MAFKRSHVFPFRVDPFSERSQNMGNRFFPFREEPFLEDRKLILTELSPLKCMSLP